MRDRPRVYDIYASPNLHVAARIFDPAQPVCVSFSEAGHPNNRFAENPSRHHRLNLVAVTARGRDWFQYPDLPAAEAAIRHSLADAPRVITYGGSMGGFAALLCSEAVGAHAILALSPQVSINASCPTPDSRWANDRARIANQFGFPHDDMAARLSRTAEVIVAYDPLDPDVHHLRTLEAIRPVSRLSIPLAGHGTIGALSKMDLAVDLLLDVMHDRFDVTDWQRRIQQRRRLHHRPDALVRALAERGRTIPTELLVRAARDARNLRLERLRPLAAEAHRQGQAHTLTHLIARMFQDALYLEDVSLATDMVDFASVASQADDFVDLVVILEHQLATEERPGNVVPRQIALAAMHAALGRREAARRYLDTVLDGLSAWDPLNPTLARLYERVGDHDRTRELQQRITATAVPTFAVFQNRARDLERDKRWEEASVIWQEALAAGVADDMVLVRLGRCLSNLGRHTEALDVLAPALTRPAVTPDVLKLAGSCHSRLREEQTARGFFERAVAANPDDPTVLRMLSNSCAALGDLPAALEVALRAQTVKPTEAANAHVDRLRQRLAQKAGANAGP